jgi:hypothetical protein
MLLMLEGERRDQTRELYVAKMMVKGGEKNQKGLFEEGVRSGVLAIIR